MEDLERCCGSCYWHQHEEISDGWVCVNGDSEYCTDWTGDEDCCPEWEAR